MIVVVDASVLAEVIVETDSAAAEWLQAMVGHDDMYWVPGLTLLEVISALRNTVTPYDAAYVALTEALQAETGGNAVLATADAKLANAPCPGRAPLAVDQTDSCTHPDATAGTSRRRRRTSSRPAARRSQVRLRAVVTVR